ncbi:hypothetical protein KR059_008994 [Drosophila kikkawai]|nr:hypothetical protein KR059_008994 [Drosophila kikkawai]
MSSLINFLNSKFKPTVVSKDACEDGFTAGNLVAEDARQLERGFKGSTICKLPVEIVFDFPKAVDMKIIKLWPSIGAMRCTAFELYGRHNGNWERIAFVKDLRHNVDSVIFCYRNDYSSSITEQPHSEKLFFLKSARKILASTNSIKVVILATEGCPPVLRKVEMWGLPARSLDKADREQVKTIWSDIRGFYGQDDVPPRNFDPTTIPQLKEQSSLTIPDKFLDSITLELMMHPTVLPSGKVVDRSTNDRFAAEEAKWGRQASDPFTGLVFNAERKAKNNLDLKTRIEEFLIKHSEHFKMVPRYLEASWIRRHFRKAADSLNKQQQAKKRSNSSLASGSPSSSPAAKKAKLSHQGDTLTFSSAFTSASSSSCSSIDLANQQATSSTKLGLPAKCINCRSAQFHYEIRTCRHVVCRDCLAALFRCQVCACKFSFLAADVKRYQNVGSLTI